MLKVIQFTCEMKGVTSLGNLFRNASPGVWAKASIGTLWDPATFYYNPSGFYSN